LQINDRAEVLSADPSSRRLEGLFAAGEVTGGVHGADRLAGNSLLDCVVFGRTAARSAADYLLSSAPLPLAPPSSSPSSDLESDSTALDKAKEEL
jgi:succinate dehydrogenase/fumarate reductase flavoprotein subunit